MYWLIGFVVSLAGLAVYLELGSYFPSRSGAEVVYLEQAYPRPRYFFPVAFAVQSVILSFSSSNAIGKSSVDVVSDGVKLMRNWTVLATYVFRMAGREGTAWEQKGVAIAGYTLAVIRMVLDCLYQSKYMLTVVQWASPATDCLCCSQTSSASSNSALWFCKSAVAIS